MNIYVCFFRKKCSLKILVSIFIMEPRDSLKKPGKLLFSVTLQTISPHPMKSPRTISPRSPPGNCNWIITLGQYPTRQFPHEIPPRAVIFVQLPLHNFVFRKLLKIASTWVVLSLNFTLAKQILQLGIIANPSLELWIHSYEIKMNFFSVSFRSHF